MHEGDEAVVRGAHLSLRAFVRLSASYHRAEKPCRDGLRSMSSDLVSHSAIDHVPLCRRAARDLLALESRVAVIYY